MSTHPRFSKFHLNPFSFIPRREGFTLVEMLVVIAIIVLLVSLIMPAVKNTMAAAVNRQCQNNLRNYAQAGLLYASDHGGKLAPAQVDNKQTEERGHWFSILSPYLRGGKGRGNRPCPEVGYKPWNWGYGMNIRPAYPRSDKKMFDRFNANGHRLYYTKAYHTYEITDPSKRLYIVDSTEWSVSDLPGHHGFLAFGRHNEQERVNASFFDGSVRSLDYTTTMLALNPDWEK